VSQDVNLGVAPLYQFAVFPDFPVAVSHGHVVFSRSIKAKPNFNGFKQAKRFASKMLAEQFLALR
jgi:hypothetical protein